MEKEQYDIEAIPPESLRSRGFDQRHSWHRLQDPRLREMLQALLTDRLQLKVHRTTKTGPIYLLVRSGKKLRLRPTGTPKVAQNPVFIGLSEVSFAGGRWFIFNTSMQQLTQFAANYVLHVPVLDRTGLGGQFNYEQPPPLGDLEANAIPGPDSCKRLMREIGLQLTPSQGPVEIFVVDQAERPSAN